MRARLAAALSKFLPSPLSRQAISRTPRLIVLSSGVQPRVQRRGRPFVRGMPTPPPEPHPAVDRQHGEVLPPLIALGLARGRVLRRGEKRLPPHRLASAPPSRRRLSKVREEVADLFLAAGDDLPRRGLVDRVGDPAEGLLHLLPHPIDELLARHLGRRFHGKDLLGKRALPILTNPHRSRQGNLPHPQRLVPRSWLALALGELASWTMVGVGGIGWYPQSPHAHYQWPRAGNRDRIEFFRGWRQE